MAEKAGLKLPYCAYTNYLGPTRNLPNEGGHKRWQAETGRPEGLANPWMWPSGPIFDETLVWPFLRSEKQLPYLEGLELTYVGYIYKRGKPLSFDTHHS